MKLNTIIIILILSVPIMAQQHALLIDNSGSMRPYYESSMIRDLVGTIENVLSAHGQTQIIAFSTEVTNVRNLDELGTQPLGAFTYLDRAIDHAIRQRYAIAWVITDNVQSQAGGVEEGNTEVFYRRLKSQAVSKVIIFPLLQPSSTPGLVIYAIQLSPESSDAFETEISEFTNTARGTYRTEALRMKPLDRNTLEINFIRGNLQPNKTSVTYQEGKSIREIVEVRFKSRFEHLKIVDSTIEALQAKPEFGATSLLKPDKRQILIDPEKVTMLEPQRETEQLYRVTMDLGRVQLKRDLKSLWKAAWGRNYEDLVLNLSFVIQVPQENFRFKDTFLSKYSASSPEVARSTGRIYGIETLPLLLSEKTTPIAAEISLPLRIEYPWWPAFFWVLLFLLGTGILLGLVVMGLKTGGSLFTRPREWSVTAETIHGAPLQCEVVDGQLVVEDIEIGSIKKNVFLPASGITLDGEEDKVSLEDGLILKVDDKTRQMVLKFADTMGQKEETSAYIPEAR